MAKTTYQTIASARLVSSASFRYGFKQGHNRSMFRDRQPVSYPSFVPPEARELTEATSTALLQNLKCQAIATPLSSQPILTTYARKGSGGTPILLLHGFDSSALEFRRLLPHLAAETETWAVDLLGFGFTERPPELSYRVQAIRSHKKNG